MRGRQRFRVGFGISVIKSRLTAGQEIWYYMQHHGIISANYEGLKMSGFIKNLSKRLFWDVDPETIDDRTHCRYVIQRVLERGTLEDIRATIAHYTMPFMIAEAQQIRSLDPVTLAFAACLGNVKEETFRCYSSIR